MGLTEAVRGTRDWVALLAAIGTLSFAVTASVAGKKSPLARPLATLFFVLFGWNFSPIAHHYLRQTGGPAGDPFTTLDAVFTALSPPLVLEVVLVFVGGRALQRSRRSAAWAYFGLLALASAGGFFSPHIVEWNDSTSWSMLFLVGYLPALVFEVVLLVRHIRQNTDAREKARARIVLAALAIGGTFSMSDVLHSAGLPSPYLGSLGTLIAAGLLTTLIVRHELFDRNVSLPTTMYILGMIASFVVAYFIVLSAFEGKLAVQVFAALVITLLVGAVARELSLSLAETRARAQRLAVLGRFSAQMAHDIKGPLTALLGAVQVLEGADDDDAASRKEFLGLVSEQAKRIGTIVNVYDRMARVEPQKTLVRVNELVRAVAHTHGVPDDNEHLVLMGNDEDECDADRALLESALENILRNAVEACMDAKNEQNETNEKNEKNKKNKKKSVRVLTESCQADGTIVIRVTDEGAGMDPRVLERASEDFFTTKAQGSGLGLSFARRVAEAHGGTLKLTSRIGQGTTVELRLPR